MRKSHDVGGRTDVGPVDRSDHTLADWERMTHAMIRILNTPERGIMRTDEMRRTIEGMDLQTYELLSYYQRWVIAIESLMLEKGILTKEEIDAQQARLAAA
jgi:nitrile hydratase